MIKDEMKDILNKWVATSYKLWMDYNEEGLIEKSRVLKESLEIYNIKDINIINFDKEKITYNYIYRATVYTDIVPV